MSLYQQFIQLHIDHEAIGWILTGFSRYYCTPKGAKILGRAGIDGIHYCRIRDFGETVFSVNPGNKPGKYVRPIAGNFEDLLRLLLACGSMDAIEQFDWMNEEQFYSHLKNNPPNRCQLAALDEIHTKLLLEPMPNPYDYLQNLQANFDVSRLSFCKEYYKLHEPEPVKKPKLSWKVTYNGGFFGQTGRGGKELPVNKHFTWGEEKWIIPAVYLCGEGLVVDLLAKIHPEKIRQYMERWDLRQEQIPKRFESDSEQITSENPLIIGFRTKVCVNGNWIRESHSYGDSWIPQSCLPKKNYSEDDQAKQILSYYGCDISDGWAIFRVSLPWAEKRPRAVKTLEIALKRESDKSFSEALLISDTGEKVIQNPANGKKYTLTVHEFEPQEIGREMFGNNQPDYPSHIITMLYSLFPEEPDFCLRDCRPSDSSRSSDGPFGIIGININQNNNGTFFNPDKTPARVQTFCSSLHFEPFREVTVKAVFCEQRVQDIQIRLI